MESVLQPPPPFQFEKDLVNITSGNLSKEWQKWRKSFKIYFQACELSKKSESVQINILLHIIGDKCLEVFEQIPDTAAIKTTEDLLLIFDAYFSPKKNIITIERHRFFTRIQKEYESVEQYVFELNKMAANCEFQTLKDDLVKDRLIGGITDSTLKERLLRETDLNLSKTLEICRLAEISKMQAGNMTEAVVHQVLSSDSEALEVTCVHRSGTSGGAGRQRNMRRERVQSPSRRPSSDLNRVGC